MGVLDKSEIKRVSSELNNSHQIICSQGDLDLSNLSVAFGVQNDNSNSFLKKIESKSKKTIRKIR